MTRAVRIAKSARLNFARMLAEGREKFGDTVADEKRRGVQHCIEHYLTAHPRNGLRTPGQSWLHYPVRQTPFTVIYEFDDTELRVLFIIHIRQDRRTLSASDVDW